MIANARTSRAWRRFRGVYTNNQEDVPPQENVLSPNLLAVSKQIHSEGVGWLYKQSIILQDTMVSPSTTSPLTRSQPPGTTLADVM